MPTVLVTGVGGPAGQNCAVLFKQAGWRVVGVDMRDVQGADKEGIDFHLVPACNDPHYLPTLTQLMALTGADVLLPTVSEELPLIAREAARSRALVAISPSWAVDTAHDKYLTWQFATAAGIPVPAALLASQAQARPELIAAELGLPFISKPRVGRGGRGIQLHQTASDVTGMEADLMLQAFAPGTEYSVNLFCGADSEVVVVLQKLAMREGVTGNATKIERVQAPDVRDLAIKVARGLGLRGLVDMDVRRTEQGEPRLLEVNARAGANIRHAPEVFGAFVSSLKDADVTWPSSLTSST